MAQFLKVVVCSRTGVGYAMSEDDDLGSFYHTVSLC